VLSPEERPAIVHVVDELPVTTWYRPMTGPLRRAGIPEPGPGKLAWYLDASGSVYRPLTAGARRRLLAAA
jgi:putative long chain acyl-CoA synthase